CTIDTNFVFSAFSYVNVSAFAHPVTPDQIIVTPGIGASGPTVNFAGDWEAAGLISASESLIVFSVDSISPGIKVDSITLSDHGTITSSLLGLALGTATVAEVDCYGGLLNFNTPSVA